ncbi:carbon storage regulator [Sporolactobacillus sp. THM7-7]|nr:carbon storage regulator [Sporolactobacillus sp. THM7-7]
MLVLTRKPGQSIRIGDRIEVKIIEADGDQIKLGISAPREIDIHRQEVYDAIQKENNRAAAAKLPDELMQAIQTIGKKKKE